MANNAANQISEISPLAGLTSLTDLLLLDNQINDIAPLVANAGIGSGDTIDLRSNPLNKDAILDHIPALEARGATILWDTTATPTATATAIAVTIRVRRAPAA